MLLIRYTVCVWGNSCEVSWPYMAWAMTCQIRRKMQQLEMDLAKWKIKHGGVIRQTERKEDKITHGGDSSTNCIIFDIVMEVFKGSVQGHNLKADGYVIKLFSQFLQVWIPSCHGYTHIRYQLKLSKNVNHCRVFVVKA